MKVLVLCGGNSSEREISINSGENVCKALRSKNHNGILVDVFFDAEADAFSMAENKYDVGHAAEEIRKKSADVCDVYNERGTFFGKNVLKLCREADIVFLALHGKNGEDGKCQAVFDLLGIKYTGAGYLASAIAMDKGVTKQVFSSRDVSTANSVWIRKGEKADLKSTGLKLPLVVKLCNGGSSVGVYRVFSKEEYDAAIAECWKTDDDILIEEMIIGREFSVGIIDGKALPVIEIIPKEGWYDYENKYKAGATEEICPANLDRHTADKMKKLAVDAYTAVGCESYARVDIMMDGENNMYCLEVNTLPGMTKTSLVPREAKEEGMDFPELCEYLIEVSMKKYS